MSQAEAFGDSTAIRVSRTGSRWLPDLGWEKSTVCAQGDLCRGLLQYNCSQIWGWVIKGCLFL